MNLIDKDAVLSFIDRRVKKLNNDRDFNYIQIKELELVRSFVESLLDYRPISYEPCDDL